MHGFCLAVCMLNEVSMDAIIAMEATRLVYTWGVNDQSFHDMVPRMPQTKASYCVFLPPVTVMTSL